MNSAWPSICTALANVLVNMLAIRGSPTLANDLQQRWRHLCSAPINMTENMRAYALQCGSILRGVQHTPQYDREYARICAGQNGGQYDGEYARISYLGQITS